MIIDITNTTKNEIINSNFSKSFIDNCINSKFLAVEIFNSKIIGVGFVGGFLNSYGIEILENFRGKGISKKLLNEVIQECKKRNFSIITGVFKPTNNISVKLHIKAGFVPCFSIYYNNVEKREIIVILPLNIKGKCFLTLSRFFNSRLGNIIFLVLFKLIQPFLRQAIAFSNDVIPRLDIGMGIKNYQSVNNILDELSKS